MDPRLLYHLVREALFDVAKHAGTDRARVVLEDADGQVVVRIEDAGKGFGLSSIRERLELVGGRLEVESTPGEGTRITLSLYPRLGA